MLAVVALAPLLDIVAGALLQAHDGELRAVPAVLILIPPFISQAGALGGILSSRISSKLQLGVITSRGRPEIPALVDGAIVVVLGVAVFTTIGAVSWALSRITAGPDPGAAALIGATMLAGASCCDHVGGRLLPRRAHLALRGRPRQPGRPLHRRSWTSRRGGDPPRHENIRVLP